MKSNGTPKENQPDAEQYARVVLWHLSTIQAHLNLMQSDIIRHAGEADGASVEDILRETSKYGKQIYKHAGPIYLDALAQANIKPSPTFPPQNKP